MGSQRVRQDFLSWVGETLESCTWSSGMAYLKQEHPFVISEGIESRLSLQPHPYFVEESWLGMVTK